MDSGVRGGATLIEFAEAIVAREPMRIGAAADAVARILGIEAVADAAGVASNFERMVRIADATGISLDARMADASEDVRESLGLVSREAAQEVSRH